MEIKNFNEVFMQFVVPQFIDVESKIIGPITPRQFIIFIVTAGFIFLAYKLADFTLFIIEAIFLVFIAITIAFVKFNGQPIYYLFLSIIHLIKKPALRVWRREEIILQKELVKKAEEKPLNQIPSRKVISSSHLSQIALLVDTGGQYEEE